MRERICDVCEKSFIPNSHNQKRCSIICQKEAWRRYMRERSKEKYNTDEKFREKNKLRNRQWRNRNKNKINEYMRNYLPEWRKEKLLSELSPAILSRLKKLAEKQEDIILIKKDKCEVCGKRGYLVIHHISYSPIKIVTLCSKCHSILHNCLLNGKKVRVIIKE